MNGKAPHIVQYQGSKRILAPQILQFMPNRFNRLIEPFAGMAAISVAAAYENRTNSFHINDLNGPLVRMLQFAIEHPQELIDAYSKVWQEQFLYGDDHVQHFYIVREKFNNGEESLFSFCGWFCPSSLLHESGTSTCRSYCPLLLTLIHAPFLNKYGIPREHIGDGALKIRKMIDFIRSFLCRGLRFSFLIRVQAFHVRYTSFASFFFTDVFRLRTVNGCGGIICKGLFLPFPIGGGRTVVGTKIVREMNKELKAMGHITVA